MVLLTWLFFQPDNTVEGSDKFAVSRLHKGNMKITYCLLLAKKIKELVDDKAKFADWSTRDDIKNQLNMDLTILLYQNGYPLEWDEEVFEKVMEQAENFQKIRSDFLEWMQFSKSRLFSALQRKPQYPLQ